MKLEENDVAIDEDANFGHPTAADVGEYDIAEWVAKRLVWILDLQEQAGGLLIMMDKSKRLRIICVTCEPDSETQQEISVMTKIVADALSNVSNGEFATIGEGILVNKQKEEKDA